MEGSGSELRIEREDGVVLAASLTLPERRPALALVVLAASRRRSRWATTAERMRRAGYGGGGRAPDTTLQLTLEELARVAVEPVTRASRSGDAAPRPRFLAAHDADRGAA